MTHGLRLVDQIKGDPLGLLDDSLWASVADLTLYLSEAGKQFRWTDELEPLRAAIRHKLLVTTCGKKTKEG